MASNDVHEFSQRNPIQLKRQAAFCVDAYEKRPRLGALQETQIVPSAIFDCLPDEFPSKIRVSAQPHFALVQIQEHCLVHLTLISSKTYN